jgi:hypothetical protein
MGLVNAKRDKRAYVAYLQWLLESEYHKTATTIDGRSVQEEIEFTEKHIADLNFVINRLEAVES